MLDEQGAAEEQPQAGGTLEGRVEELQQQVELEKSKAAEYLENWQRTQADMVNYRRRSEQEKSELLRYGNANLLLRVLPVLDDFERAWQTLPAESADLAWVNGLRLVERKLKAVLEQEGVTAIEALGTDFDPNVHEAVAHEDAGPENSHKVVAEFQKGYRLHDRVLRPSMVKVGK